MIIPRIQLLELKSFLWNLDSCDKER